MSQLQYKLETPFNPPQKKKQTKRSVIDMYSELMNTSFADLSPRPYMYHSRTNTISPYSTPFYDAITDYYTRYTQDWERETR